MFFFVNFVVVCVDLLLFSLMLGSYECKNPKNKLIYIRQTAIFQITLDLKLNNTG